MKFKHIIIAAAGVVLLSAGCNMSNTNQAVNNQSGTNNANQTSNTETFTDSARNISLDYSNLNVQTTAPSSYIPAQNNFPANGNNLLALHLNPSKYSGTNVESAWFNLSVNPTLNQQTCYSATAGRTGIAYNQTRSVQGNAWHYSLPNPSGDGAAGHSESTETYRLYKNNLCYETRLGVSSFNRQNLENPNSVKDYDLQVLFGYLGAVFNKLIVK
jgi:hypothetical protein